MARFRIWHLLVFIAIVAISVSVAEHYSRRNVVVEIYYAKLWTDVDQKDLAVKGDYAIYFKLYDDPEWGPAECMAVGNFGYNSLLDKKIATNSLTEVENLSVNLIVRRRPYPWSAMTKINDELSKHFEFVHGLPEPEYNSHARLRRRTPSVSLPHVDNGVDLSTSTTG